MNTAHDARSLALAALDAIERRDAHADAILDGVLSRNPELARQDRALTTQLVYGVLRWRNRLDAHIAAASRRPLAQIHPRLLQLLRLGAYQILFLDRVPARAAVNEAVTLARRTRLEHATAFVNAVLRNISDSRTPPPLPADPAARLGLLFGCPAWLVEHWTTEHGPSGAESLARAASEIPPLFLRVDLRHTTREAVVEQLRRGGIEAEAGAFCPEAVAVSGAGDPRALDPVRRGVAVVQAQAAQLVAHLLAPEEGWRVLDACAAPGLKTTHLAALGAREVTALDVYPQRARMVRDLARGLGHDDVRVIVADATLFHARHPFDAVLVDAPCSGLGVLARTPEAKWRRTPEDLAACASRQRRLLDQLAEAVRPGGVLVYATCTTARVENEEVIGAFLRAHRDFRLEAPTGAAVPWSALTTPEGYLKTYPELTDGRGARHLDGFFGARLRRAGAAR